MMLVTALVDIDRHGRNFEEHYIESLKKVVATNYKVAIYGDWKYRNIFKSDNVLYYRLDKEILEKHTLFEKIQEITKNEVWLGQSEWMRDSIIASPYYILLTNLKSQLLTSVSQVFNNEFTYWVDSGIYGSYNLKENFSEFNFLNIPKDKFFITSFSYKRDDQPEIHGLSKQYISKECGYVPDYVCRATVFGGTRMQIAQIDRLFYQELQKSLENSVVGTEEAIYTILSCKYSDLFHRFEMPTGDIYNFLQRIKERQ
jgi:hypothetical protein